MIIIIFLHITIKIVVLSNEERSIDNSYFDNFKNSYKIF